MCGAPAGSTRRERSTPEGAAGVDGCLTFSSILRTPLHSTRNPCLQLLQCDGFETASDLQGCRSARLFAKPAAAWLGRLGRKEGGSAWRRRGLSAEFAELHFSVSHRNSGGGRRVWGVRPAGEIMLACDYALPLCSRPPSAQAGGGCNVVYMGFFLPQTVLQLKPSDL